MSSPLIRRTGAAPPVRLLHLGLGGFFRAHQAWYTDRAADGADWGYAAFGGRGSALADQLTAQEGLYTLVTRAGDGDGFQVLQSLSRAHGAADHQAWLDYLASPEISNITITVTEAGYLRRVDGSLDLERPEVQADVQLLRQDRAALVHTAPGRLVAGLAARHAADAGPVALIPCDNLAGNGAVARRVVLDLAGEIDSALAEWIVSSVSFVTTAVDRITPRGGPEDARVVLAATGLRDACPVVTEPFAEWVLSGDFPVGRPDWESAGAIFTDDVSPYEHRKLWLLNGAHSLLAYAGSIRGHTTVAEAIDDVVCRAWVEQWWDEAARHLGQPAPDVAEYRGALLDRFANRRIRHLLTQVAADGSQKLPIRIAPVLRMERAAGRTPEGATRVLAAWICHLRGMGAPVSDVRGHDVVALAEGPLATAVPRVLNDLDEALGADPDVVSMVAGQVQELTSMGR